MAVKVILSVQAGLEPIDPAEVSEVRMYVFDKNERLLEIRQTEINKLETINYKGEDFKITTIANAMQKVQVTEPAIGGHKSEGKVSLKKQKEFNKTYIYNTTDDILWGELDIKASEIKAGTINIFEVPVKRVTAGVFIRIYGLNKYAEQKGWNKNFSLRLNARHDELSFYGKVSDLNAPVFFMPPLGFPADRGVSDILECPGGNTDETFFHILSTDNGCPVSVDIYNDIQLIHTASTDDKGNIILAENGKMCLIEIYFNTGSGGNDGDINIKIANPKWGYIPPIGQEF